MFSSLSALVIDAVGDEGSRIVVRARTAPGPAVCSRCGAASAKIHSYHHRTVADLPVDGRVVVLRVRVRRLVCPTPQCCRAFREQVPGLLERYQRRTARLNSQVRAVVRELARPGRGNNLDGWMKPVREAGLTELDPFLRGLDQDHDAAVAGLTVPYSNGPIEGVNTKTKLIKRQMYGRASFELLRHRILLA